MRFGESGRSNTSDFLTEASEFEWKPMHDVEVQYKVSTIFVSESIVATSGTFSVKLPKHYFGLGITFTGKNSIINCKDMSFPDFPA